MLDKAKYIRRSVYVDLVLSVIGYAMLWHIFGLEIAFMTLCVLGCHELGTARAILRFLP